MVTENKKIQPYKQDAVKKIRDEFQLAKDFIFTDYRGLTVEQITDVRKKLREQKAAYRVVKNRFAKIALRDLQYPEVAEYLVGPTAIAIAKEDSAPVAKLLLELSKELPLKVKGGLVDKNVFNDKQLEAFSKLPGKKELIAMLMSTMQAPLQNFVYALNAVPTKLVRTLQAVADKKAAEKGE